jgi:hypothetical protein
VLHAKAAGGGRNATRPGDGEESLERVPVHRWLCIIAH